MMGPGGCMGGMGGWLLLGGLLLIALLVLVIVGTIWLVRNMRGSPRSGQGSAVDELERRYALGEIDREEFTRAREDLAGRGRARDVTPGH